MEPDFRQDADHHDGTSDATPGGYPRNRRPGEISFTVALTLASLYLLREAYGISGFDALSGAGAVPMATTFVMVICALVILARTVRLPLIATETIARDILPGMVLVFVGLLAIFGALLVPLGFLPTALLFLIVAIKLLARKSWGYTLAVAFGSLVAIWIVFRVVFTVLLPSGIVPEAEFLQMLRTFGRGGAV